MFTFLFWTKHFASFQKWIKIRIRKDENGVIAFEFLYLKFLDKIFQQYFGR